jgi:hypothetical protein
MRATFPAHIILLELIVLIILEQRLKVMKLLIMQSSPTEQNMSVSLFSLNRNKENGVRKCTTPKTVLSLVAV